MTAGRHPRVATGVATAQAGIVLVLALVIVALLGLTAATLIRAVDTATGIMGNLGFREASIAAAGAAVETAIASLSDPGAIADRDRDLPAGNYYATRQPGEDTRGVPWLLQRAERYPAQARHLDAGEGNTLRYVVERVCRDPGPATAANCALAASLPAAGAAAEPAGATSVAPFYRITVRVDGPQHTVSHVQAVVQDGAPPRRLSWRILE